MDPYVFKQIGNMTKAGLRGSFPVVVCRVDWSREKLEAKLESTFRIKKVIIIGHKRLVWQNQPKSVTGFWNPSVGRNQRCLGSQSS